MKPVDNYSLHEGRVSRSLKTGVDAPRDFNGKLRDECLNGEIFYSLKEAQILIEPWRVEYNLASLLPHVAM